MKKYLKFQTTAVLRAAQGVLDSHPSSAPKSSYSFSNHALQLSGDDLKVAWKDASIATKQHARG
ncbi:hypothetical protein [Oceanospirillum maris]|uniref:hypothetical protein n=1 Tax=Oceanospirillum maris TaxID=64977 RepID=UPI000407CD62|nr:hypothetical protein [Oceanospirillum maris]